MKRSLLSSVFIAQLACGPSVSAPLDEGSSGVATTSSTTGLHEPTSTSQEPPSTSTSAPDETTSDDSWGTTRGESGSSGGSSDASSSSSGDQCGCVGEQSGLGLDDSVGGYTANERIAMFPTSARLRWTAVSGAPETTVQFSVTAALGNISYGEGGDPCGFVPGCNEGFHMSVRLDFATDDGLLVGGVDGSLWHDESSLYYEGLIAQGSVLVKDLDPAFLDQNYQREDGSPLKPYLLEVSIFVDPETGELERFSVSDDLLGEPAIAELVLE